MRKWRVGSVSMGLSLILLGVLLFVSQIKGMPMMEPLLVWWPIILIVLGIEIVVYLFLSKQENPILKYDFLSIIFVGIIGTIGIGFTLLSSIGVVDKVEGAIGAEHRSMDLPVLDEKLSTDIKRVVLETNGVTSKIEGSIKNELHVFGVYQATVHPKADPIISESSDYVFTKAVGDTMYVTLKEPAEQAGPFSTYTTVEPTIIVPSSIHLEVRGQQNHVSLYPGSLENNWVVDGASNVSVHVAEESNILLSAISNNELENGNMKWDKIDTTERGGIDEVYEDSTREKLYKGTKKLGEGTYKLSIFNSDLVTVNLVEKM
ncbi:hypothetical protein E1I69_11725 [Bacillus timonensis]|uniref:Exosporium protein E n=1 Tax=Bacillus timonensis TaxID=1033734 RepID=A0A4V3V7W2_9BACI|nr:hypothetical protein [Bacillus timonensis]THE12183.1 hypothetical protein E1I69_11725 [Bacillus timonensis]